MRVFRNTDASPNTGQSEGIDLETGRELSEDNAMKMAGEIYRALFLIGIPWIKVLEDRQLGGLRV